jgi:hypothetical protein
MRHVVLFELFEEGQPDFRLLGDGRERQLASFTLRAKP